MTCVKMSAAGSSSSRDGFTRSHRCSQEPVELVLAPRGVRAQTLRHAHRAEADRDARLALDTMTDVKSVDVGGALFGGQVRVRPRAAHPLISPLREAHLRQPDEDGGLDALAIATRTEPSPTSPILQVLRCENQGHVLPEAPGAVRLGAYSQIRARHPPPLPNSAKESRSILSASVASHRPASRTRALTHTSVTHQLLRKFAVLRPDAPDVRPPRGVALHRLRSGPQVQHRET